MRTSCGERMCGIGRSSNLRDWVFSRMKERLCGCGEDGFVSKYLSFSLCGVIDELNLPSLQMHSMIYMPTSRRMFRGNRAEIVSGVEALLKLPPRAALHRDAVIL